MLPESAPALGGRPAGFWRRFAAGLIDGIVIGVASTIVQLVVGRSLGTLIGFIIAGAYFGYFHGTTGRTPGNAALGITVVSVRDGVGQPIGYSRAVVRWLMSYVSAVVILIGYLWMLWDPQKQTWHDKVAGSLPIHTGSNL